MTFLIFCLFLRNGTVYMCVFLFFSLYIKYALSIVFNNVLLICVYKYKYNVECKIFVSHLVGFPIVFFSVLNSKSYSYNTRGRTLLWFWFFPFRNRYRFDPEKEQKQLFSIFTATSMN